MGNNNLKENENLHIRLSENNVVCIDPNSIVNQDNFVQPRDLNPEDLVLFVNLEADLIPRSELILPGENETDKKSTLLSIAEGKIMMMKNQSGGDLDTTWSDFFTTNDTKVQSGFIQSGQGLGIESISMNVNAIGLPKVTVNLVDVRGKTLMSGEKNTPYAAFFHLPWPIFYLTIKGYYGKAIRYRLHMTSFVTKYNDTNGNFDITIGLVGQTYAYLSEIPLDGLFTAPYMYGIEVSKDEKTNGNEKTITKKISKTSKGYITLKSVYDEYKAKGLISKDFPILTLRELVSKAKSLDKLLEKELFNNSIDFKIFGGLKELEGKIDDLYKDINIWNAKNLSSDVYIRDEIKYHKLSGVDKTNQKIIYGKKDLSTLEYSLIKYNEDINRIISYIRLYNKESNSEIYKKLKLDIINNVGEVSKYVTVITDDYQQYNHVIVNDIALKKDILDLQKNFKQEKQKIETFIEVKMNNIIKDKNKGIGFDPTIRNVFAVVLANAEVLIKLLKDVHVKAFEIGPDRKKYLTKEYNSETKQADSIFPWPKITKPSFKNNQSELAYPGSRDLVSILNSNDKTLWPEVDFIENYISISTKKEDTLSNKETGVTKINYIMVGDIDVKQIKPLSNILFLVTNNVPYTDKTLYSVLYEIYERAKYISFVDTHSETVLSELARLEFENIQKSFEEDLDIVEVLKKIQNESKFHDYIRSFSPYEKYPYYLDNIDTTMGIKDVVDTPFEIKTIYGNQVRPNNDSDFIELPKEMVNYKVEDYRNRIYPFNSSTYLNYIGSTTYNISNTPFIDVYKLDTQNGFVSTPKESAAWIKSSVAFGSNMFLNTLLLDSKNNQSSILNTPYFHNAIYKDFTSSDIKGKYVRSSYLLLNSLPFKSLDDKIKFTERGNEVRIGDMFKEVSATHYIPYHLILKYGSIYHRYKKYLTTGVDILDGVMTTIDGRKFFDNNLNSNFANSPAYFYNFINPTSLPYTGSTYNSNTEIGIHPFYEAIFTQVVNDYTYWTVGDVNSYATASLDNVVRSNVRIKKNKRYYTSWIDNSKLTLPVKNTFTLLPTDGYDKAENLNLFDNYSKDEQNNLKLIWTEDNVGNNATYVTQTISPYEYFADVKNEFTISSEYKKIVDLIGTFSPEILDEFEKYFLDFASPLENVETSLNTFESYTDSNNKFHEVKYQKFQTLLKDIVTVDKLTDDDSLNYTELIPLLQKRQDDNLSKITNSILSYDNLIQITLGNPREYNTHVLDGFTGINKKNTLVFNEYSESQYTTGSGSTKNLIDLYIGQDIDGNYKRFFTTNNIELNEENIRLLRPLILMFAGGYKDQKFTTKKDFIQYIVDNVITPFRKRFSFFLGELIIKFNKGEFNTKTKPLNAMDYQGYNNDVVKLDLYNFFKSFNDKWSSGNSIGKRTLLEEFFFIDRANRDIGDLAYLDIQKLIDLEEPANDNIDLYSVCNMLIGDGQNFDMRPMPGYINFYNVNQKNSKKSKSSNDVANMVFGKFLEVDYEDASPRIIIQYINDTSKHLELEDVSDNYFYKNDGIDIGKSTNNPLIITNPEFFRPENLMKSNMVVGFDVSIGDQNQSLFKNVSVSTDTIKNTTETFKVWENIGRSDTGASAYQIDSNLLDVYRQASYSCEVTMLGDMMIQPTMYFHLNNLPIFRGSYLITEVNHSIRSGKMSTSFKGIRVANHSLPTFEDSFTSSYKSLFDRIVQKSVQQYKEDTEQKTSTEQNVTTQTGSGTIDNKGVKPNNNETLVNEKNIDKLGIKYNGYENEKTIQKIKYKGEIYYKASAVKMGSKENPMMDDYEMSIVNKISNRVILGGSLNPINNLQKLTWKDVKNSNSKFYSCKFYLKNKNVSSNVANVIYNLTTTFINPNGKNGDIKITLSPPNESTITPDTLSGAVNVGPNSTNYGISLSPELFDQLEIKNGDFIYFRLD